MMNALYPKLFIMLLFLALYLKKVLQLQLLYCSCSSRTFLKQFKKSNYLCVPDLVKKNKLISNIIQIVAAAAAAMLQLQGCSCSNIIFLDRFRMSNNPCVCILVIMNALFPKFFNLLLLPALYSQKVLQLQQLQQQYKFFWNHDLDPYIKWGKVSDFQKKISSGLVVITEKL